MESDEKELAGIPEDTEITVENQGEPDPKLERVEDAEKLDFLKDEDCNPV